MTKKVKTVTKGKVIVIAAIMLVFVFAAPMSYAASRGDKYNHIVVQPTPQKVLIGQNLQFEGFATHPIVSRLVSGNVVNTYPADSNDIIYNVNWPMSGAYYVNYNSTTKNADAQLSVEAVNIPLELKVGTTKVSFIAVGTKLRVDTAGINLFDEDIVDLIIKGPAGQIKIDMKNDQTFTGITVSELKAFGTELKTTGWKIGDYTFQVKTDSAQACGLDAVSEKRDVKRGGSYYEPSPTQAPKKENEVPVPHLTPIATPIPTVTPTVTAIQTPIASSTPEPSPTPSPAVSPTPTALIQGSDFLFAIIGIIIAVGLFRHRK